MGRPLKIAKAQTVLTITGTDATTEEVTVSQTLSTVGVIAGMPFIPASTTGGLTGGTTYWILSITGASTFTVSATPLNANPTYTPVNLSGTSGTTVATTVGLVDYGFSNPDGSNTATNSTSYGVVGGNTALYGSQVLCNVAFGVNGTGTVFASTSSNIVVGLGTDFANLATGTRLFAIDASNNVNLLGTGTSTKGNLTVAVANTANTGNIIGTSGNAQTLSVDTPVTFTANLGGLVTGTTYFVKAIANADAFTVSTTRGGAEVDLSDATGTPNAVQNRVVLGAVSASNASGPTGLGDPFIQALPEAGYIVRQKGKTKYLVTGTVTGITGQAFTANVANTALTPNTMSIISTNAASGTNYVSSVNDYNSEVFPTQVAAGSLSAGVVYTIYNAGTTNWTAVGAYANMTGITFTATGAGSGTGTEIASNDNPDVIATFGTDYAANTYGGQPNPIVTINNA
jgi:hypothetical protein